MSRTHDISTRSHEGDDGDDDEGLLVGAGTTAGEAGAAGLAAAAAGAALVEGDDHGDEAVDADETVLAAPVGAGDADEAMLPAAAQLVDEEEDDDDGAAYIGWGFLAALFCIFLAVALWAFSSDDDSLAVDSTPVTTVATDEGGAELAAAALVFQVDGETVTLTGAVPDEATREQLVSFAEGRYETVVDQLTIDDGITMTGGTLTVTGTAVEGDEDPAGLQADAAVLGLDAGAFDVTFAAGDTTPAGAEVAIASSAITLTGSFPDQASLEQFVAAVQGVYGAENVDASGLTVDENTTLAGSTITITGLADAGDTRAADLEAALAPLFGDATVDASGLTFDTSAEALAALEESLTAELAATPILFDTNSFDVDDFAENQGILERAAAAINAAPGVAVEVVGHTDTSGDAGTNQLLSEDRANAVMARLIELGVDAARLTARGAGETEPLPDVEGDAAENRRIVFEFAGAASADEGADEAGDDTTTTIEG